MGSRVVVVGGLEAWLRGETLKECQSDFCHVLHPPSLPPSLPFVGYVVGSFGGKSFSGFGVNNDVEGPAASAPADNDDA